jgi:putative oxidoreductase
MDELFLLGRIVFGGYFAYNGVDHFLSNAMLAQHAAEKRVPMPEIAVALTGVLLLVGGVLILLGLAPHLGAACIVLFLAGVTPIMHNFWAIPDPAQRTAEMYHFTKNLALLGAAFIRVGVPRRWPYSFERRWRLTV